MDNRNTTPGREFLLDGLEVLQKPGRLEVSGLSIGVETTPSVGGLFRCPGAAVPGAEGAGGRGAPGGEAAALPCPAGGRCPLLKRGAPRRPQPRVAVPLSPGSGPGSRRRRGPPGPPRRLPGPRGRCRPRARRSPQGFGAVPAAMRELVETECRGSSPS